MKGDDTGDVIETCAFVRIRGAKIHIKYITDILYIDFLIQCEELFSAYNCEMQPSQILKSRFHFSNSFKL